MESFLSENYEFADLFDGSLFESINYDDLSGGFNVDDVVLPDLEMDTDMFAEYFSSSRREESEMNPMDTVENNRKAEDKGLKKNEDQDKTDSLGQGSSLGEEIVIKRDESVVLNSSRKEGGKGRKSSSQIKNPHVKRNAKVDWTPELHKRFVQAVEVLGVDKAVPSRIQDIMGIDFLTRHNIASHLQKYRSHRKHLLARESEAARWNQMRQMYGVVATSGGGGNRPWLASVPTIGFPSIITTLHYFRPLHVWGHPSMHMSPLLPPQPRLWAPAAAPPPPQSQFWEPAAASLPNQDPSLWHNQHQQSEESIDAAIGDVLSKPWLPLPLGLKLQHLIV